MEKYVIDSALAYAFCKRKNSGHIFCTTGLRISMDIAHNKMLMFSLPGVVHTNKQTNKQKIKKKHFPSLRRMILFEAISFVMIIMMHSHFLNGKLFWYKLLRIISLLALRPML